MVRDAVLLTHLVSFRQNALDLFIDSLDMVEIKEVTEDEGEEAENDDCGREACLIRLILLLILLIEILAYDLSFKHLEKGDRDTAGHLINSKRVRTVRKLGAQNLQRVSRNAAVDHAPNKAIQTAKRIKLQVRNRKELRKCHTSEHQHVDEAGVARTDLIDDAAHHVTGKDLADTEEDHGVEAESEEPLFRCVGVILVVQLKMPGHDWDQQTRGIREGGSDPDHLR